MERPLVVRLSRWRAVAVILVPVTAALGSYLLPIPVLGINIFAYRLLILFLLPLGLLFTQRITWWGNPVARSYVLLGSFWVLWGVTSYFWSPDPSAAIRDVLAVVFGFSGGVVLLLLQSHSAGTVDTLRQGWLLAYLATGAVAIWEVLTKNHLPSTYVEAMPDYVLSKVAISTFSNPNNYGAFLILSAPFMIWSLLGSKGVIRRTIHLGALGTLPVFVVLSASRVAIVGLAAQLVVYGLLRVRRWRTLIGFLGVVIILSLSVGWLLQSGARLTEKMTLSLADDLRPGGSIARRLGLLLNGLWFVYTSGGLGVGAGAFEYMIRSGAGPFAVGPVYSPHNFWIEVVSQYGILVFVALVTWGFYVLTVAIRARRTFIVARELAATRMIAEMMLIGLIGYLFASLTNSAYIVQSTNWMFLGTLVVLGTFVWNERASERGTH